MKIVKRFLATVSSLVVALLVGCSTPRSSSSASSSSLSPGNTTKARTLDEVRESGTIRIGIFSNKKPFGYVDDRGDHRGYDTYFADRLARDLGMDVEYVAADPTSRVEYLTSAKVDIILANFIVTGERTKQVDSALSCVKVTLGVVSPGNRLTSSVDGLEGKTLIVDKGTTAETCFERNYPKVNLLKYDQYSEACQALLDGRGDALSTDNTEVLARTLENKGYKAGVIGLGDIDTIIPAVQKGNIELLDRINDEIETLGEESFLHRDYEGMLEPAYGDTANPDGLVVEGGNID